MLKGRGMKHQFNEWKTYGEFVKMYMECNESGMSRRWKTIEEVYNKFHEDLEQVRGTNESGKTMEDNVNALAFVKFGILFF